MASAVRRVQGLSARPESGRLRSRGVAWAPSQSVPSTPPPIAPVDLPVGRPAPLRQQLPRTRPLRPGRFRNRRPDGSRTPALRSGSAHPARRAQPALLSRRLQAYAPYDPLKIGPSVCLSLISPSLVRVLTVPSGWPRVLAISL